MESSGKGKTVLVTGGSGFVAAHILNSFLSRGYNVKTTVRSASSAEKIKKLHVKYLSQLSFAIVPDVATPGGHDDAVKGVDGVIHTASPFQMKVENNERDLLEPAIKGTMSVLTSVQNHAPNVKRVIITSSFASIDINKNPRPGYTYTESDWNPVTYEEAASPSADGEIAYLASKTLAERAAWDFVAKNKPNFQLATICPPMVYGPAFHTISSLEHLNTSSADIYRLINGSEKTVPKARYYAFCDVRDVGEAHARAYETHESAGQVCDTIREDFPEKKALVPEGEAGDPVGRYKVDNSKIKKELGMTFRDLRTCIDDQVREFIEIEKRARA